MHHIICQLICWFETAPARRVQCSSKSVKLDLWLHVQEHSQLYFINLAAILIRCVFKEVSATAMVTKPASNRKDAKVRAAVVS